MSTAKMTLLPANDVPSPRKTLQNDMRLDDSLGPDQTTSYIEIGDVNSYHTAQRDYADRAFISRRMGRYVFWMSFRHNLRDLVVPKESEEIANNCRFAS